mgnify:CR=1 FL=1
MNLIDKINSTNCENFKLKIRKYEKTYKKYVNQNYAKKFNEFCIKEKLFPNYLL